MAPASRNPEVRALHDPPEIWDLVHETRTEFQPRSAFITHLTSANPLVLGAIALIIVGGAVFGFMNLRGGSGALPRRRAVQAENSSVRTPSSSRVTVPNTTAAPAQLPIDIPASTEVAGSRVEPNTTVAAPTDAGPGYPGYLGYTRLASDIVRQSEL